MALKSPFMALSNELKLAIIEILVTEEDRDALHLSSTCTTFRHLATPYLFTSITLRNTDRSAQLMQALAASHFADNVVTLNYQGVTHFPPDENYGGFSTPKTTVHTIDQVLPESVADVLSNLNRFNRLRDVIIEFPWDEEEYQMGYGYWEDVENTREIEEAEGKEPWRALMKKSYDAIESSNSTNFTGLELRYLVPKVVSSWWQPNFCNLLSRLESFRCSLRGGGNGAGWHINTSLGYSDWATNLDAYLFDHLPNLKKLSLAASSWAPIGSDDIYEVELPIRGSEMPMLEELELSCIFIDNDLENFIQRHSSTLRSIRLLDCCAPNSNFRSWFTFLTYMKDINSKALQVFEITPKYPPGSKASAMYTPDEFERWSDEQQSMDGNSHVNTYYWNEYESRSWFGTDDPSRQWFRYAYLDDKYGMVFHDDEQEQERHEDGNDQKAYNQLMQQIRANNASRKR